MSPRSKANAMGCFWCGEPASTGVLCGDHASGLRREASITPEQLHADLPTGQRGGSLIDCFGAPYPIASACSIGRARGADAITILHHSVSLCHATLEISGFVEDQRSLNGTFLNDEKIEGRRRLFDGDVVRFGDVAFFYSAQHVSCEAARSSIPGSTMPISGTEIPFVAVLDRDDGVFEMIERPPGGLVRTSAGDIHFSKMEFSLLRALLEIQRVTEPGQFIASAELARALEFRSIEPGSDNVRELVKRVRRKAKANGVENLIASRSRHGYRLAGDASR